MKDKYLFIADLTALYSFYNEKKKHMPITSLIHLLLA